MPGDRRSLRSAASMVMCKRFGAAVVLSQISTVAQVEGTQLYARTGSARH